MRAVRALVLFSSSGNLQQLAKALAQGLEAASFQVDLMQLSSDRSGPISVAPYDVICVGSPTVGLRGHIAPDIEPALGRCSRLEGKRTAAFVRRGLFGSSKALRRLMAALERQGAWVEDFADLANPSEARAFGERLKSLARRSRQG